MGTAGGPCLWAGDLQLFLLLCSSINFSAGVCEVLSAKKGAQLYFKYWINKMGDVFFLFQCELELLGLNQPAESVVMAGLGAPGEQ